MAITKILYRNGGLRQAIDYITNPVKTDENLLTDYVRCDPGYAAQQMMDTKRALGKTAGRQCYHIIQSFKPDEITPELAHEIARQFAAEHLRDTKPSLRPMWTKHIFTHILCSTRSMPSLGKCITAPARITTNRFAAFQIGCAKRMV